MSGPLERLRQSQRMHEHMVESQEIKAPPIPPKRQTYLFHRLVEQIKAAALPLNAKALRTLSSDMQMNYDQPMAGKHISTSVKIYSTKDMIFEDCPELGEIHSLGKVILIRCPNHGKITAGDDIHLCDSEANDLICPKGKTLYIYDTKYKEAISNIVNKRVR